MRKSWIVMKLKKHRSLFRQMTESHHNNKQKFFRISVDIWSGFRRRSSTLKRKKTLIRKKVLQQQLEWRRKDFQSNDIWCGDICQMRDIRVNYFGLKVKKCYLFPFLSRPFFLFNWHFYRIVLILFSFWSPLIFLANYSFLLYSMGFHHFSNNWIIFFSRDRTILFLHPRN